MMPRHLPCRRGAAPYVGGENEERKLRGSRPDGRRGAVSSAAGAHAAVPIDSSALRDAVTLEGVRQHQAQFQEFADLSGGTLEASTQGHDLSADYVAGQMEAAGSEVTRQPFEYNFYEELAAPKVAGTSP